MTSADTARADALAWLTGRLRWERLLSDLHERADAGGEPVVLDEPTFDAAAAEREPAEPKAA